MAVAAAMAAAFPSGYALSCHVAGEGSPPLPTTTFNRSPSSHLAPFTPRFRFRLRHHRAVAVAAATLREVCGGRVPDHVLQRAEEVGYVVPTEVQEQSLPVLLSGQDCILHAQTGSGKTLAYLLSVFSAIDFGRSSVQALVVVPTRELGIQVTKVARMLAAKACTVMALLDGGMLRRQKSWVKAEPPAIIVATVASLCQMVEKRAFSLQSMRVLVIDEVDFIFGSSKQGDVVHVHVNPVQPMPSHLRHKYLICSKKEGLHVLLSLLERDAPKSGIIFVAEQTERSKKAGNPPSTTIVVEFLRSTYKGSLEVLLLEEDMNFNARAASFSEVKGRGFLLVSTDIASRGFDLPQTSHIYNFDLPKTATDYLHRAGRTGREPFSKLECGVTTVITEDEQFVLQRFQNELKFHCEELPLESMFTSDL
ncbi:DEAD-box ATP-dependent RNA helicase 58, chloroplastic isoform X2 [Phragmites australis]|uniref:DEAD-box ATP-dependent RNA helicase 58, chloroplastic isoform X2 n=1 Tax=Phragmites australis TaxID=29695 RepID=UPI002D788D79|nr:DEAD-box ATP-dependent RNA helicase 58, chloroplastic isoform X2 [Phragmites australis]